MTLKNVFSRRCPRKVASGYEKIENEKLFSSGIFFKTEWKRAEMKQIWQRSWGENFLFYYKSWFIAATCRIALNKYFVLFVMIQQVTLSKSWSWNHSFDLQLSNAIAFEILLMSSVVNLSSLRLNFEQHYSSFKAISVWTNISTNFHWNSSKFYSVSKDFHHWSPLENFAVSNSSTSIAKNKFSRHAYNMLRLPLVCLKADVKHEKNRFSSL